MTRDLPTKPGSIDYTLVYDVERLSDIVKLFKNYFWNLGKVRSGDHFTLMSKKLDELDYVGF